jgi:hypothetical protein
MKWPRLYIDFVLGNPATSFSILIGSIPSDPLYVLSANQQRLYERCYTSANSSAQNNINLPIVVESNIDLPIVVEPIEAQKKSDLPIVVEPIEAQLITLSLICPLW